MNVGQLPAAMHPVRFFSTPDGQLEWKVNIADIQEAIRSEIHNLIEMEPSSGSQLADWYKSTTAARSLMELDNGELQVPHALWHYLADADIRLKDREYSEAQLAEVQAQLRAWVV